MRGTIETRVGIFVLAAIAVFAYMSFQVGAFRFDTYRYNHYSLYFHDVSGLSRKAEVRIAGVKVGWVEKIILIPDDGRKAKVEVMVLHDFVLYENANGIVRQDGFLGPKFIEIIPGDPLLHRINPGGELNRPSTEPVAIDELLQQFKSIASNVQEITDSFKDAVGGDVGKENLRTFFENLSATTDRLASFSDVLNRSFVRNEDNLDQLLGIGSTLNRLAARLESDVFPSFQQSIEKISYVFDRDFDRIATQLTVTAESIESTSNQAKEGLKSIGSVADKLDEGKGLLGKIINEDDSYQDLKAAIKGFKEYVSRSERISIVFDSHIESMHRPAEHLSLADSYRIFEDSKGYFDIRIHTSEDQFYVVQLVNDEKGSISRTERRKAYRTNDLEEDKINVQSLFLDPTSPFAQSCDISTELADYFPEQTITIKRNSIRVGVQIGKIFHDIAFRIGMIEGAAGFGVDVEIPFKSDKFRWVTTVEAFDFIGWNRIDDRRPHIKWLNKMFVLRAIYFTFGADDFMSKHNASAFVGLGLRFGDDDIKYLLPSLSSLGGVSSALAG